MSERVVVVGAGVIGLLTARELALAGLRVTLVERGESGREASWAGGGIVSPLYPWRYSPAVTALAHWSQDFYPALGQRLLDETGLDPEVHTVGLYWLDLDDQTEALQWARKHTRPLKEVPIEEAYAAVPGLGAGFQRAVYMSGVANVRNPRLARSLRASLQQFANLELHEQTEVRGWLRDGDRVVGVATSRGEIRGDKVLLAAGAWSGELLKPLGLELPVVPVKGQMILYKCAADFLPRMVLAKGRYAIPRRDGHILIGSTLEHSGFDKTPTDEAQESLRASAAELLPELADMQPVAHWAGLRPALPKASPISVRCLASTGSG